MPKHSYALVLFVAGASFCACTLPVLASSDPTLERIHSQLSVLRTRPSSTARAFNFGGGDPRARGATPMLTDVKHELRDWIEKRLANLQNGDDGPALTKALNAELMAADLTCDSHDGHPRCVGGDERLPFDGTGYVTGVSVEIKKYGTRLVSEKSKRLVPYGHVVVQTSIGILCGSDTSVYVYEWDNNSVKRILDDEQPIRLGKLYTAQSIDAVNVSEIDQTTKTRNVLILGNEEWCSSTFYPTYHRIWRTFQDGRPAVRLLNDTTYSWLGGNDPPIEGSIGSKEALIELRVPSLDAGVHSYEAIRHYALRGSSVERVDPIALGPRAFTEEWLKASSKDSATWSATSNALRIKNWHHELHGDFLLGEFGDTDKCTMRPDTWQVAIEFTKEDRQINKQQTYVGNAYFAVEWTPPYHFRMFDVDSKPFSGCNKSDPDADADRTLFPIQDWMGWK